MNSYEYMNRLICRKQKNVIKRNSNKNTKMRRKMNIDIVRDIIEKRNGILLTDKYTGSKQIFEIKCVLGHIFKRKYYQIEEGYWCQLCNTCNGEAITREVLQIYFNAMFPTVRPKWLGGLELDGYNEELNIAFEYDG